ncbi:AAA family ATPase [Pollutimonas thiosulfatoxidans]|nr:ATP-binding protein [Pollutimonas thiosulfatoxidans]
MDNDARLLALSRAFSPSAPIDQRSLFSGRISQLMDVMNAVAQKGQHAILFGERGVGKTSLARVISTISQGSETTVASVNCDPTTTFDSLWRKIAREIPIATSKGGIGFTAGTSHQVSSLANHLPETVTPDDIRHLFSRLRKILIVIDEFDRITDGETSTLMADTVKTLSDHAVDTTLLLVGVADSVEVLISEHQSVERALIQIRMPRMSRVELNDIVEGGLKKANMTISVEARQKIAALSQGLPHYTHLLAQNAAQRAAITGRSEVNAADVRAAIDNALAKAQQSTIGIYHKATNSPRENLYPQVLLACAMAEQDNLGYFAAVDIRAPLSKIMGKAYDIPAFSQHLNAFCDPGRGPVLQRTGSARRYRFRFINPLLQPYVLMNGIKRQLIKETDIPV